MHPIAARAIAGDTPIAKLVEAFYSSDGPLAEAGWEIRASQREMSIRFAEQIDGSMGRSFDEPDEDDPDAETDDAREPAFDGSIGLIEAPCGVGKGGAYLIPGFLGALRAEAQYRGPTPNAKVHPAKLIVSTANIALQSQLVRKDIPALGRMLGVEPRATLMKSRQNYVCREALLIEAGSMYGARDQGVKDIYEWTRKPGCDGDRESYAGDVSDVWHKVSVGSDECGRQSCPHYDLEGGSLPCFWRQATAAWPSAHIIVGNHHWVALSKGIKVLAYAVDEAHELEGALRGVQGRTLSTSTFVTAGRRGAKALKTDPDPVERRMTDIAVLLFDAVERLVDDRLGHVEETRPQYRAPVPLTDGWCPEGVRARIVTEFGALRGFRDKVAKAALDLPYNSFSEGEIQTRTKERTDDAKVSRQAAVAANKLAELCRIFGAVALGRPHPDWPSHTSPWAIWAHREKDGRDQWRVVVELVPADVAPAFAALQRANPTMVLASATLPDFTSMRLSLGLGARWTGTEPTPWPNALATDTGLWARKVVIRSGQFPPPEEPDPDDLFASDGADLEDEPTSNRMATSNRLAPEPLYERRLPSPYALESMGVLVVPDGPAPKDSRWPEWATRQVVEAVKMAGGGVLVLATSNAAMKRYAEALRAVGRWTVIRQGETGRSRTIQAFKDEEDSVLVGTRSFFQGLDVQGRSCRLVVIDRIPFASPDDPLENAVGKLLVERATAMDPKASGASPWMLRSIPEAGMVLVQGIGRLIRSQEDRGAVVLLDNRILNAGPGWALLRAGLPPFPLSHDLRDVGRVIAGEPLGGVVRVRTPRPAQELSF